MWFKQIQLFHLNKSFTQHPEALAEQLEAIAFKPCLPSLPASQGWVSPLGDDEGSLVYAANGYMMLCLQIEEKVLPAIVIRQELANRIKEIETKFERKVSQKEKLTLKDEVTQTLLPRAFTKLSHVHAYIDTKRHWLVLNTVSTNKIDIFFEIFKRCVHCEIKAIDTQHVRNVLTRWFVDGGNHLSLSIAKACVLQDASQESRVIRCKEQDLFADSIQSLVKDGCEVKQMAMSWLDNVDFVLDENLTLRSIRYNDELIAQAKEYNVETEQQQFDTDFFIMTETLTPLLKDLLKEFVGGSQKSKKSIAEKEKLEVA